MLDQPAKDSEAKSETVAVLVTYGDRRVLLQGALEALDGENEVFHVVIVDNGCFRPILQDELISKHTMTIIRVGFNSGSAGGFQRGIEAACKVDGAKYLLLLDDDNYGSPGFVSILKTLHACVGGGEKTVLAALRRNRSDYVRYLNCQRPQVWPNSFLGFTISRIPAKIMQVLTRKSTSSGRGEARIRAVSVAPYGGLFMEVSTPQLYGMPDPRLVLYGDDHEFVLRLSGAGVQTFLTDLVHIDDLETSWNERQGVGNTWIAASSPAWRIYFALRNRVLVEKYFVTSAALYICNISIFTFYLAVACLVDRRSVTGARNGMRPIFAALSDGLKGRLETRPEYELPGAKAA